MTKPGNEKAGFRWWRFVIAADGTTKLLSPQRQVEWARPELEGERVFACPSLEALKIWQGAPGPDEVTLRPEGDRYRILSLECSVPGLVVVDTDVAPLVEWWMFSARKLRIVAFGDAGGAANLPLADLISRDQHIRLFVDRHEECDGRFSFIAALQDLDLVNLSDFKGKYLDALGKAWGVEVLPVSYLSARADRYQLVSRAPQFLRAHSQLKQIYDGKTAEELAQGLPEIVMSKPAKEVTRWAMKQLEAWEDQKWPKVREALTTSLGQILELKDIDTEVKDWAWRKALRTIPMRLHALMVSESKETRDRFWNEIAKDIEVGSSPTTRRIEVARTLIGTVPELIELGEQGRAEQILRCVAADPELEKEVGEELIEILPHLVSIKAAGPLKLVREQIERAVEDRWSHGPKLVELVGRLERLKDPATRTWAWKVTMEHAREVDADIATDLLTELHQWRGLKISTTTMKRIGALVLESARSDPDGLVRADIRRRLPMARHLMQKQQFVAIARLVDL